MRGRKRVGGRRRRRKIVGVIGREVEDLEGTKTAVMIA
jgi:hypothetical protein